MGGGSVLQPVDPGRTRLRIPRREGQAPPLRRRPTSPRSRLPFRVSDAGTSRTPSPTAQTHVPAQPIPFRVSDAGRGKPLPYGADPRLPARPRAAAPTTETNAFAPSRMGARKHTRPPPTAKKHGQMQKMLCPCFSIIVPVHSMRIICLGGLYSSRLSSELLNSSRQAAKRSMVSVSNSSRLSKKGWNIGTLLARDLA